MERREVVNASKEYDEPGEWTFAGSRAPLTQAVMYQFPGRRAPGDGPSTLEIPTGRPPGPGVSSQASSVQVGASQGVNRLPCLYFGPAGERCNRPALDSGFCARHQANASPTALPDESRTRKKKTIATLGIIATLWPLVEELIRQIFRLLK